MLEQPPLSLRDHYRQRKRWALGIFQNWKNLTRRVKALTVYRVAAWIAGLAGAIVSVPLWFQTILSLPYQFWDLKIIGSLQTPFLTGGELLFDLFDGDIVHYLSPQDIFALGLGFFTLLNLALWLGNYVMGVYLNDKWVFGGLCFSHLLKDWLLFCLLVPFIGFIESYPVLGGIRDFLSKNIRWDVTPKMVPNFSQKSKDSVSD